MQGLISAGSADRKWLLVTVVIMAVLSIATLLLATEYFQVFAGLGTKYARLLVQTAKMYLLGAVAVAVLYFMARARLRIAGLRMFVLCLSTAVDIFLGARFIVDTVL